MQILLQDLRYALRLLRRSPGFTITALLTLAVAIGANTSVFSAVQAILITPLPYDDPDRLVRLFEQAPTMPHFPMAPADFRDYRAELQTFDGLAAYQRADLQLGDAQQPEQLRGMQVTAGFFSILGWRPALGREFDANDERPGNGGVVILSHGLWRRRFDADPGIIGRTIRLSGGTYRVVGVLPEGFAHVGGTYRTYGHDTSVDVWSVLAVPPNEQPRFRYSHYFNVVGRVRAGVTWSAIGEDLKRTAASVARRYPSPNSPWTSRAVPLKEEIVGTADATLWILSGAAGAVLLLACLNLAGLLIGRGSVRSREIGVRAALGATKGRLAGQLMIESTVLGAGGGLLGVGLAYAAIAALRRFGPADLPRVQTIAVDGRVLIFAAGTTIACALLFGLAPALRLARTGLVGAMREGGRSIAGSSSQQLRRMLVGAEVAVAFVLVVASGLLLRSFVSMLSANPGFNPTDTITASVELPGTRYDSKGAAAFFARAAERLRQLPGVRAVAFTSDLPWTNYDENTGFSIVGRAAANGEGPEARYHFITDGYTAATGTPLVAGRALTPADVDSAPRVVLLNESAARKYWSTPDAAVGAQLDLWGEKRTVAGVIGDVKDMPWHTRVAPALYFPQAQVSFPGRMYVVVRSSLPVDATAESIRRAVQEIDPQLPLANAAPLATVAGAAVSTRRLALWLVGCFGAAALLLAVVGIYGVLAQSVAQRRHELGVRQALGATRGDVMRLVLGSGARMALAGLAVGAALAMGTTRLLASLLYSVTPLDPATFVGVAAVVLATSAAAAYLPAWRATRVSAAAALRSSD